MEEFEVTSECALELSCAALMKPIAEFVAILAGTV